jgi:hypothetical protein
MKQHQTHTSGIAERLGRWSSEHRTKAIFGWLALLLVALVAASGGAKLLTASGEASGDSAKAERLLERGGFRQPAAEEVLLQARDGRTIATMAGRKAARPSPPRSPARAASRTSGARSRPETAVRSAATAAPPSSSSR